MPLSVQRTREDRLKRLRRINRDCQHQGAVCARTAQAELTFFELDEHGARRTETPQTLRLCTRHRVLRESGKVAHLYEITKIVDLDPLGPVQLSNTAQ